jgi:hypothetical protein
VTVDCHELCERRANPHALLKTLATLLFLNRRGERRPRADRQERSRAAVFADVFTGD